MTGALVEVDRPAAAGGPPVFLVPGGRAGRPSLFSLQDPIDTSPAA